MARSLIQMLALLVAVTATPAFAVPELVDLSPADEARWGIRNVAIGLVSVFGGWNYWYAPQQISVETVPAEADLSLYYVRGNFQRRYEQALPPIRLRLPSRADSGPRDWVTIRVGADGYSETEVRFRVHEVPDDLRIELAPLPNSLTALVHAYLGGRSSLTFHTMEKPQFRVSRGADTSSFVLSLTETADLTQTKPAVGGLVRSLELTQVREDLLVRIEGTEEDLETRSKHHFDSIRGEHVFVLELIEKDSLAPSSESIRRELRRLRFNPADRCHGEFEKIVVAALDPKQVKQSARRSGTLASLYRKEAMLYLGQLDQGVVVTTSGDRLRTGHGIELEMALQRAVTVKGYVALLGTYARNRPRGNEELRSLLLPEFDTDGFNAIYRRADAAYRACKR